MFAQDAISGGGRRSGGPRRDLARRIRGESRSPQTTGCRDHYAPLFRTRIRPIEFRAGHGRPAQSTSYKTTTPAETPNLRFTGVSMFACRHVLQLRAAIRTSPPLVVSSHPSIPPLRTVTASTGPTGSRHDPGASRGEPSAMAQCHLVPLHLSSTCCLRGDRRIGGSPSVPQCVARYLLCGASFGPNPTVIGRIDRNWAALCRV